MKQKNNFVICMMILLFALAFFPVDSFTQAIGDQPLKVTISLDKEKFLVNEAIWLTIVIENISKNKTLVASPDPIYGLVRIEVVSHEGDTLYGGCIQATFGGGLRLDPGEKDTYFVNIVGPICNYGVEHEDALHDRLLPEGKYNVQAKVWYRYQGKSTPVLTNKLGFKVEKPKGREKKAYDLLVKGRKKCYPEQEWKEGREMIWRMIEQYPNSVYRDVALELVANFAYHPEEGMKFIEKYPNSGLVASVIFAVTPKTGKSAERKKFYEDIIKKYPHTKAGLYAENQLDKWRRGKIWVDEPIE
ncbi:MAG: hypothetical protein WBF13_11185 [Candidatus Zixiibacteriota bacterium]